MASSSNQDQVIPASRRPDGTWRKERRVKAGYTPPDEVEKYESKGKRFTNNQASCIPGLAPVPGAPEQKKVMSKNQKKNERRKQKRKEESDTSETPTQKQTDTVAKEATKEISKIDLNKKDDATATSDNSDILKKIKNVRKKLKQCDQILEKKNKGETLEKEQIDKLGKRDEFQDELDDLEALLESKN